MYRRPLGHDPLTLDPARADYYGTEVVRQVFAGLVKYDDSLSIVPVIAESWHVSDDGLSLTFHLRKGVKFHHGREVTAEDFVYSLQRVLDRRSGFLAREVLARVAGASDFIAGRAAAVAGLRAPERYLLEIRLSEPAPAFIHALALMDTGVVPREIVERLGDRFGDQPVGAGPFRFVRWTRGKGIVLEANKEYFSGRPHLDRIEFKIFTGAPFGQMLAKFEEGALEDSFVPAQEVARFVNHPTYQYVRRPNLNLRFLGINTAAKPLDNVKVRQALNYAIDQEALAREVHHERYEPAFGVLPPAMAGYDPRTRFYPYNTAKAKALLGEAGYPGGRGLLRLEIWSSVRTPGMLQEDQRFVRSLGEMGIAVEMKYNIDFPSFRAQAIAGKLPIFRHGWAPNIPDPDYLLFDLFSSQSPKNLFRYRNSEVDSLLQRARGEWDFARRVALYREAHSKIMEDAPLIPLTFGAYERVFQSYVRGIHVNALGDYMSMERTWLKPPPERAEGR
jgi:ABC-type transport system substrate-binding protein